MSIVAHRPGPTRAGGAGHPGAAVAGPAGEHEQRLARRLLSARTTM
jgi:hypothetical protein